MAALKHCAAGRARAAFETLLTETFGTFYDDATRTLVKTFVCTYAATCPNEDLDLRLAAIMVTVTHGHTKCLSQEDLLRRREEILELVAKNSMVTTLRKQLCDLHPFAAAANECSTSLIEAVEAIKAIVPSVALVCTRERCVKCLQALTRRGSWPAAWRGPRKKVAAKTGMRGFSSTSTRLRGATARSYSRRCLTCKLDHYYDHAKGDDEMYFYRDWRDVRFIRGIGKKALYYEVKDVKEMAQFVLGAHTSASAVSECLDAIATDAPLWKFEEHARSDVLFKRKQLQLTLNKYYDFEWQIDMHGAEKFETLNSNYLCQQDWFTAHLGAAC